MAQHGSHGRRPPPLPTMLVRAWRHWLAIPLAALALIGLATVVALTDAPCPVTWNTSGAIRTVAADSSAWAKGIRPGWTIVPDGLRPDGVNVAVVTDGRTVRALALDPLGPNHLAPLLPSLLGLILALGALLLGMRRSASVIAIVAAAAAGGVLLGRFGFAALPAAIAPELLSGVILVACLEPHRRAPVSAGAIGLAVLLTAGSLVDAEANGIDAMVSDVPLAVIVASLTLAVMAFATVARRASLLVAARERKLGPAGRVLEFLAVVNPMVARIRSDAASDERTRIASELHAGIIPALALTASQLDAGSDPATAAESVRQLALEVRELMSERWLPVLDADGLVPALEWLAERVEERARIVVELDLAGDTGKRPPSAVEHAAYRIVQLALDNVIRHAGATMARVEVAAGPNALTLRILDDGCGIKPTDEQRALRAGRLGIADMQAQAASIDATLSVEARRPRGTRVSLGWSA